MFLSRVTLGPPKAPRNVFFPWFNFTLVKSGTYLEPNRIAFRVPVHLTKFEIRDYLRKIYDTKVIKVNTYVKIPKIRRNSYGDYYKNGAIYKKAIVTCEETIPDEVKMLASSKEPHMNPAITKYDTPNIRTWVPFRPGVNRRTDWAPRHPRAWQEAIPTLLRGDDFPPPKRTTHLSPDPTKPHLHTGRTTQLPHGVPEQPFPRMDLSLMRRIEQSAQRRAVREVPLEFQVNPSE